MARWGDYRGTKFDPDIEQHGPTGPRSLPHRSPLEASVSPNLKWWILGAVLFWLVVIYLGWVA